MGEPALNRHWTAVYQLAIVAAACAIFLPCLGRTGLWDMDEALYASIAREMFQGQPEHSDGILPRPNGQLVLERPWIVPRFNGQLFPEKPPLMFWTMMAGFELFGVNEFGARFFSVMMGVGTALIVFHLGRLLFCARVGFWAGLITCSTIVFTVSARAATVDSALTFVTALAMLFFVLGLKRSGSEAQHSGGTTGGRGLGTSVPSQEVKGPESDVPVHPSSLIIHRSDGPLRWPYAVAMYACIGLAVLAKGPVGMLLPLAAMGLYMLVANGWRNLFRSAWQMRPFTALVVIAAVALPWYIEVGRETQWEWPRRFLLDFNLRPFQQPIQTHGDVGALQHALAVLVRILYHFYYVPGILFGFFPWAVFLGPALVDAVRRIRQRKTESGSRGQGSGRDGILLASCWFGVWFVFWSVCKTKLPHYLLPAYPALGLLVACWLDRWLEEKKGPVPICAQHRAPTEGWSGRSGGHQPKVGRGLSPFSPWGPRNAWLSTILAGVGIMIALPIVATYRLPGEEWLGLLGLILVLGGGWCWWESAHQRRHRAAIAFSLMSVVFLTAVFGFAALRVDQHQNAKPMIAAIHADWGESPSRPPIATYGLFRESTVFYAGRPVTRCSGDPATAQKELKEFFARHGRSYVITSDEDEREVKDAFPGMFEEIFRQQRFPEPESSQMVILRASRPK